MSNDTPNDTQTSTLIGMFAIPLWSVSIGFIRSVSEIFGPIAGAALIYTASGLVAALVLGLPRLRALYNPGLWWCGLLFVGYEISLALAIGLAHNRDQALELGMINYLWPSVTVLFAVISKQQRGSPLLAIALVFCLVGIGLVMNGGRDLSFQSFLLNVSSNPLAYLYALAAAFLWGLYSVVTRHYHSDKTAVPFYFLVTAAILWIKYALSAEPHVPLHLSGLAQVFIFGSMSATAYACWNRGICRGNISLLATMSYFTPVLAAVMTCLWLGIRPGIALCTGVAMITAGSLLSWRASHPKL
ncbi:aromatic amino acid DMT transporter YddG [Brucella pseudogrignonensis]|uniref:aromatic amino acid DMT transporter YddG n=1 Tax=Brucella pseudogrignonensis TaxID=419475 RepID=UPI000586F745|nr:aromatic amino acid DMT transporter YddG [Brucella pseudogrignonensis]